MAIPFRLLFFFSSFGPLYLIFAIKLFFDVGVARYVAWIFVACCCLAVIAFRRIVKRFGRGAGTPFKVSDVKAKDSEIFSYITTYIPPLISPDMSKPESYLPLLVLYVVICVAYLRLESPYLNPFFILFGYRVYEGRLATSRNLVTIISRRRPIGGCDDLVLYELGTSDLYYRVG